MDEELSVDMDDDQRAARERQFWACLQILLLTKTLSLLWRAGTCCWRNPSSRPSGRRLADLGPDDIVAYLTQAARK